MVIGDGFLLLVVLVVVAVVLFFVRFPLEFFVVNEAFWKTIAKPPGDGCSSAPCTALQRRNIVRPMINLKIATGQNENIARTKTKYARDSRSIHFFCVARIWRFVKVQLNKFVFVVDHDSHQNHSLIDFFSHIQTNLMCDFSTVCGVQS